jgi:hypothetical protein
MDFLRKSSLLGKKFVLLYDNQEVAYLNFGVAKLPETYVLNSDGQVMRQYIGAQDWSNFIQK